MSALPRSTHLISESSVKCGACKNLVKDTEQSGIGCSSFDKWFYGDSVSLSLEEIRWLGSKPNVQWSCDVCLADNDTCLNTPTEAKINFFFAEF